MPPIAALFLPFFALQDSRQPVIDAGAGELHSVELDDSIPLPVAALAAPGARGDRLLTPASGDPFFLGFYGGSHYPPSGERLDPLLAARAAARLDDGRPRRETYAFAIFQRRITPARVSELEALGCRVLGFQPHYALALALPPEAIDVVAALEYVHWLGLPRDEHKVHPLLAVELATNETADVCIVVRASDLNAGSVRRALGSSDVALGGNRPIASNEPFVWRSNGWQQRALEALGVEVESYAERHGAFSFYGRLRGVDLAAVTALDFVHCVEGTQRGELMHDESMTMVQSDVVRVLWNGGTSGAAVAGIADSGFDVAHVDFGGMNAVGWNLFTFPPNPGNPWADQSGHGTHVLGTLLGRGVAQASLKGGAPGLGSSATTRVFCARIFQGAPGAEVFCCNATGIDPILDRFRYGFQDGGGAITPKPHVINHSWGSAPAAPVAAPPSWYVGTEDIARRVDDEVYSGEQLHVFACGNSGAFGPGALTAQAASKNGFAVGNVVDYSDAVAGDPGARWTSSSRGPCGDTRWKPNVVAPGRMINSARAGSGNAYVGNSGTSMAAPHVSGIAAQLVDQYAWLRYKPARLASHLMASAMTRDDAGLSTPADAHLHSYGAGRVEAYKASYSHASHWRTTNWGFDQGYFGGQSADFDVPAGTTRIVVCLTYHEPGQAGGNVALINNLDLWLDGPSNGLDPALNTGEYFAHQSTRDNVEIRTIENPDVGTWRWKVYPTSVPSIFNMTHASVAVCTIQSDTTPDGLLTVSTATNCVPPDTNVNVVATAYNPSYVASAVFLDSIAPLAQFVASEVTLKDGAVGNLMGNQHAGEDVLLGDITAGDARQARWTVRYANEGVHNFRVDARSDNWVDDSASVNITVDGTGPGAPGNLHSTTHALDVWSNDPNVAYAWNPALDNLSGLAGYGLLASSTPALPAAAVNISNPAATAFAHVLASGVWHFNLRAVDGCGNWSTTYASVGPIKIDTLAPAGPTQMSSSSHNAGFQSCFTTVTVDWAAASDAHSGLAGYCGEWDSSPSTDPTGAGNIGPTATSHTLNIGSSANPRWFHLVAIDVAGNRGTTQHFGPVLANTTPVTSYCTGKTNSLGCVPSVSVINIPSLSGGNFEVRCDNVINQKVGLLFWGDQPSAAPFQGGLKCVAAPTVRTPLQSSGGPGSGASCSGQYTFAFTTTYLGHQSVAAGDTLYAQWWMRDPASASTTGLSNGVRFVVCE